MPCSDSNSCGISAGKDKQDAGAQCPYASAGDNAVMGRECSKTLRQKETKEGKTRKEKNTRRQRKHLQKLRQKRCQRRKSLSPLKRSDDPNLIYGRDF